MIKDQWQNLDSNDYIWIIHRDSGGFVVDGHNEEPELMRVRLIKKPNESRGGNLIIKFLDILNSPMTL